MAAAPASAQNVAVVVGAGPTIPVGDFADFAKTGWMVGGGVLAPIAQNGLWIGAEAMYGQNSIDLPLVDESWTLMGAGGLIGMTFTPAARVSPFVFGSLSYFSLGATGSDSDSDGGVAYGAGAGLTYAVSPTVSLWGLGRFISARIEGDDVQFIPLTVGLSFTLGSR